MADTAITETKLTTLAPSAPRALNAVAYYGEFVGDDTDYHIFRVATSGKGKFIYGAFNPTNKDMVMTLYGSFVQDSDVGDTGVFGIDTSGKTVSSTSSDYETTADTFPWIFVRCKFAATPDSETVVVYVYVTPS